jgi:hypothetical protein
LEGINEYILDRPIAELPEASIREFWASDYDSFVHDYGIVRNFPGEVFYRAKNNKFLGRECIHTCVAALDGKIYKVLFRFITPSTQEYEAFGEDAYDYLGRVLINRDCSAIAGCRKRHVRIALDA